MGFKQNWNLSFWRPGKNLVVKISFPERNFEIAGEGRIL
jgi:hypothetical protein